MIRRDTALDADRPHYYSQFWIDVAGGKREVGGPRSVTAEPEAQYEEPAAVAASSTPTPEIAEPIETPPAKVARATKPKPEPKRPEPVLTSLADLAKIDLMMKSSAEMGEDTVPDIENAANVPFDEEPIVTDFDLTAVPVEEEPRAAADEESEGEYSEEFEDEDEWGDEEGPRRGSKPNKRRREPRREF